MVFAFLVAKAVKSGRRVCGMEKAKDVLSEVAQRHHSFTVEALPSSTSATFDTLYAAPHGQALQDAWEERLRDNTVTPPPDAAAFRIDFRAWRTTRTERDRRVLDDLMLGERTCDVSEKYGLTPGRVSQLRRDFHQDWEQFCAMPDEVKKPVRC
jgi:hypothetical protein